MYNFQSQFSIKSLESFEIIRLTIFLLRSIIKDENTNSDTLVIFNQLYKIQLGLDLEYPSFKNGLRLAVGDLKIINYILPVKSQRSQVVTKAFNRLE